MDVYLIVLDGQGDEYGAIVDQETWDWINSKSHGTLEWDEMQVMPARVREAINNDAARWGDVGEFEATIGSYQNDRAIAACSFDGAALFSDMSSEGEAKLAAKEWAKKNGHTIVDTFVGYIY